ncbi:B12-binding domain-containing radical SAM protein [Chloroflexota bacterium]
MSASMKVLLITPPMSNLNTLYPAIPYLTGFLHSRGVEVQQADLSIELASRLLSKNGLERLENHIREVKPWRRTAATIKWFLDDFDRHRETVEPVVAYLRGQDASLKDRIISRQWLPQGKRLQGFFAYQDSYGKKPSGMLDVHDEASYLASLYLWDMVDVIREIEPEFALITYGKTAALAPQLDKLLKFLRKQETGLVSQMIQEITSESLEKWPPDVLGLTVPFPGSLVGAMRVAAIARRLSPPIKIVMGGGYPNTYLRQISDPRFFDYVDFLTLDDGERPLECVLQHLAGERGTEQLLRTFVREGGKVVLHSSPNERDIPFTEAATPNYAGLPLKDYIILRHASTKIDQIWARRWNKLMLAHGCYWHKCSFCDTSLDYVRRFEPQKVERLIDQIETVISETGQTEFHWVDEAVPPSLLKALCEKLLERRIAITWRSNIRFERAFTPEMARLMSEAGCVEVSGGLEVASDRLLKLINKGVTVAQVARAAKNFTDQGILVHAYLMYGFPTETLQDTVDSLEIVRQLFKNKCLHSGRWHRFLATEHSPIGMYPSKFGIKLRPNRVRSNRVFGRFSIPFKDTTGVNHDSFEEGLSSTLRRYQHGLGLDRPVHEWFPKRAPHTTIAPDMIAQALTVKR